MTNGGEKHEQRRPASSPSNTGSADADANLEATENGTDASNAAAGDEQNPPQPSRPTIRFALSTSTRHIPSLHDLDEDVLQALYYDEDENGDMLLDVVRNITAMRRHLQEQQQPQNPQQQGNNNGLNIGALDANPPVDGEEEGEEMQEEYCFRGLEHMRDNTVMQMRQQARDQVIDNVLEEQERQRANEDDGVAPLSPERLAAVSRASSTSARNRGIIMGILDEAAVRRDRDADGEEEEEEGPSQQGQPRQEGTGDADNPDNNTNNRRDEDEEDGGGGGNGRETLCSLLETAGKMNLE